MKNLLAFIFLILSFTSYGQTYDSLSFDSLKKLHTLSKPKPPTYIDMSKDLPKSENFQISENGFSAGEHLVKAGNLAFGAFAVGLVSGIAVAINPKKGAIIGITGGITSTALAIMAWYNVRLAGTIMNSSKIAFSVNPTTVKFTYNF